MQRASSTHCAMHTRIQPRLFIFPLALVGVEQRHSKTNAKQDAKPVIWLIPPDAATTGATTWELGACNKED